MKKEKTVIGSALLVILVVLSSKFLGFLRQVVIASSYGASAKTDIYFLSSDFMIGFGTGGFRGIIGDDFNKTNIQLVAQAISNVIIKNNL